MHVIDLLIQKEGQRLLPMCVYDIQYACSVLLKTGSNGTVSQAQQTMCMTGVTAMLHSKNPFFFLFYKKHGSINFPSRRTLCLSQKIKFNQDTRQRDVWFLLPSGFLLSPFIWFFIQQNTLAWFSVLHHRLLSQTKSKESFKAKQG